MASYQNFRIVPRGELALVEWDLQGEKVNKLSTPVMMELKKVLEELSKSSFKAVVMISRKKGIFIAGADIKEIEKFKTKEEFEVAVKQGQEIMNQVEDLPMPVIAAIQGACLGGGCELALACDYRVAADDESTRIGLPETKLGIIPGFGGCVRLPRVVGLQAALGIILEGKAVDAKRAQKMGLVDRVTPPGELEYQALRYAQNIIRKGEGKRRKAYEPRGFMAKLTESSLMRGKVESEAKKGIMRATNGHYPAPLMALKVVLKTYKMPNRDEALKIEREGFCEVAPTDVSKNLIHVFYLMEGVKGQSGVANKAVKAKPVYSIAVLGAGTMGGGVAYAAADRGIYATMKDINQPAIDHGYAEAEKIWKKSMSKKRLNKFQYAERRSRISGTLDYSDFKNVDVVIEAVVENMDIKKKVIAETATHCKPDVIIVTNTSSLSVNEMSVGSPKPENFAGMHFFNPVDKMPLVEVIRADKTSDETTATVYDLAKRMGKTPIVVKDGPGFLVNRLLVPYLIEAAQLLQDGMSVERIDKAYREKFGMPMGPCHLMDEIGLDVCLKVSKIFEKALAPRIELPTAMLNLEKTGRLGKKNKKGFYQYDEDGKKGAVDQTIYADLGLPQPKDTLTDEEIIGRGIYNMINEATMVLKDEKIVETAGEVDLGMIMGTGFPPFRGGLLKYADSLGAAKIVDELEIYKAKYGARFKPCATLEAMARKSETFYPKF